MNTHTKNVIVGVVIVTCLIGVLGFFAIRDMAPDKIDLFSNVDREEVERRAENLDRMQAEMKGDTYCSNCDRFIAGEVRICPYCGQYVD